MRAAVARRGSSEPAVVEVEPPQVGGRQVRVAVVAAAFTYFDAFVAGHVEELGLPAQVGLGFDFSGRVTEVGPAASGLAVGDPVTGLHVDITAPARAHAEEIVVEADSLAVVPDVLDLEVAAAVPLSALSARQALDLLGPERGSLLVTGAAGAIGGWLIELGAREGWDVTALVRPGTERLIDGVRVAVEPSGTYDAVVDAAALHDVAVAAVRDGGRYVGFKPAQPQEAVRGIAVSTLQVVPDGAALAGLLPLADKEVPVRIAGRAALSDAAEAYRRGSVGSGSRGRWLLVP